MNERQLGLPLLLGALLFGTLLPISGCSTPPVPIASNTEDLAAIAKLRSQIETANSQEDLAGILACYAQEAMWLPHNSRALGRDEIERSYELAYSQLDLDVELLAEETQVTGHWAFDRGTTQVSSTPRSGGTATVKRDKYLMILRRFPVEGWKIWRLMWSPVNGVPAGPSNTGTQP